MIEIARYTVLMERTIGEEDGQTYLGVKDNPTGFGYFEPPEQ